MRGTAGRYIWQVKHQLQCPGALKAAYLKQLKREVNAFLADHPDGDIPMLNRRFGTPEEVAEEFLSEFGDETLNCCAKSQRRLFSFAAACLLAATVFAAVTVARTSFLQDLLPAEDMVATIVYDTDSDDSRDTVWGRNVK